MANAFILFVTAGRDQADSVYTRKLRRPLQKLLRAAGLPASAIKTTKRGVENSALNSGLEILAANEDTVPARSATLLLIDEGRYVSDEVFTALAPSTIAAGGKILAASTAGRPSGWFHELATSADPEVCVIRVDGNENPYADPKVIGFLGRLLRRILPSAAARDLDNQFTEDGSEFLPAALIEAAIDDTLGDLPSSDLEAFAFLDLSRRRDLTSRVVVLRDSARRPEAPDHLIAASVRVWNPKDLPTGEVPFEEVRADLAMLSQRFPNLRRVLVDEGAEAGSVLPFARAHAGLALLVEGFVASPTSNMGLWGSLAARLHGQTLSIPRDARLLAELRNLRQESFALGSKWRVIDASRKLHRDVSLALAGACFAAGDGASVFRCQWCDVTGCNGWHAFFNGLPPRSVEDQARADTERDKLAAAQSAAMIEDQVRSGPGYFPSDRRRR